MFEFLAWYYFIGIILISLIAVIEDHVPPARQFFIALSIWPLSVSAYVACEIHDWLAKRSGQWA